MPGEIKGLILSDDDTFSDQIKSIADNLINISVISVDESIKYDSQRNGISVIFIDIRNNSLEKTIDFVRREKTKYPFIKFFVFGIGKDADIILSCLRAGVTDYFSMSDLNSVRLKNLIQKKVFEKQNIKTGKVFSLFSLKGGLGVTTLSVNIADHIYKLTQSKVVAVDFNLYMGNISQFLNIDINYTPFDLLNDLDRIDDNLLFSSLVKHPQGFYMLGISNEIGDADQISGNDIKKIIEKIRLYADYIIVDLPHIFSERVISSLETSDKVILLLQQDIQSIKSAQNALTIFSELGIEDNKSILVDNRYDHKLEIGIDDLSDIFNGKNISYIDNNYNLLSNSVKSGTSIDKSYPNSKINRQIYNLSANLVGICPKKIKKLSFTNLTNIRSLFFKETK